MRERFTGTASIYADGGRTVLYLSRGSVTYARTTRVMSTFPAYLLTERILPQTPRQGVPAALYRARHVAGAVLDQQRGAERRRHAPPQAGPGQLDLQPLVHAERHGRAQAGDAPHTRVSTAGVGPLRRAVPLHQRTPRPPGHVARARGIRRSEDASWPRFLRAHAAVSPVLRAHPAHLVDGVQPDHRRASRGDGTKGRHGQRGLRGTPVGHGLLPVRGGSPVAATRGAGCAPAAEDGSRPRRRGHRGRRARRKHDRGAHPAPLRGAHRARRGQLRRRGWWPAITSPAASGR